MGQLPFSRPTRQQEVTHLRAPEPIFFPEEEEVPEGYAHLVIRTFLFQLLQFMLGERHSVGSDQFIYWNAREPRRCLSPDVFVRLGVPQTPFGSWKTWEQGGPPDLAVEVISPSEGDGIPWQEKLGRYHELGVRELVRFDPEEREGKRLRAWDRLKEDLVERRVTEDETPCLTLGLVWRVSAARDQGVGLRLVDEEGRLVETELEAEASARRHEAEARASAEARVRELEEEVRRLKGG
jgi:Uma2 family endonuclease